MPVWDWLSFFQLAEHFEMDSLVRMAVKALDTFNPYTDIDFAQDTRFLQLAIIHQKRFSDDQRNRLFRHLIARKRGLIGSEIDRLGSNLSARIFALREQVREKHFVSYFSYLNPFSAWAFNAAMASDYTTLIRLAAEYSLTVANPV